MTEQYLKLVDGVEIPMSPAEIAERQAEESRETAIPIGERLNLLFSSLDEDNQADLSPLKAAIKLELDQGRLNIAKRIIERATIPPALESARSVFLAEFQ